MVRTMTKVVVGFNKGFKKINGTRKRYRLFKGSAGSGKSVNIAQDFILKLMDPKNKGANLLVVRKIDASNKDSTFAELTAAVERVCGAKWQSYWKVKQSPLELECLITGNKVIFRGMKDVNEREKVKSINFSRGKLTWIWIEEATELQESDVDILDDRLRGLLPNRNLYYQMTFSFNPVSANHWIKRKYFDIEHQDIYTYSSTYLENRFIDEAYHRRMMLRKEQDPEGYKIYGLGEWGELGGVILSNYSIHDFDIAFERFDSMHHAQDFGFNHANALLTVSFKDGELFVCNEIYVHQMDTNEIIESANKKQVVKSLPMYCDSAEPDRIKMWRDAGYNAIPVHKNQGSVKAQIDILKGLKIHIHPSCVNTIKEIQQWKWKKDPKSGLYRDEPVEVFDDAMAALRYSIEPLRVNQEYSNIMLPTIGGWKMKGVNE